MASNCAVRTPIAHTAAVSTAAPLPPWQRFLLDKKMPAKSQDSTGDLQTQNEVS